MAGLWAPPAGDQKNNDRKMCPTGPQDTKFRDRVVSTCKNDSLDTLKWWNICQPHQAGSRCSLSAMDLPWKIVALFNRSNNLCHPVTFRYCSRSLARNDPENRINPYRKRLATSLDPFGKLNLNHAYATPSHLSEFNQRWAVLTSSDVSSRISDGRVLTHSPGLVRRSVYVGHVNPSSGSLNAIDTRGMRRFGCSQETVHYLYGESLQKSSWSILSFQRRKKQLELKAPFS